MKPTNSNESSTKNDGTDKNHPEAVVSIWRGAEEISKC